MDWTKESANLSHVNGSNVSQIQDSSDAAVSQDSDTMAEICRKIVLPILANVGIFFNGTSIVILLQRKIRMRRSLVPFFVFLNTSDSVFLTCMFLIFSLPLLSENYAKGAPHAIPYIMPILQTRYHISSQVKPTKLLSVSFQ